MSLESKILVYQIKFLLARAYSVAVRLFVSLGFVKAPQELNPEIGDKQNLRYSHRFAPFMHLREPSYVAWDQYESISKALVKTTSLDTCIQLFNTAKQNIEENMDHLPVTFEPVLKIITKNVIVCKVLNSPVGKLKKLSIVDQTRHYPLFTLL